MVDKYVACTAHAQELADLITQELARQENELIHREMRGEFLTPDEVTPNGHHVYRSRGTMIPPRISCP